MIRRLALVSFFSALAFTSGACREEAADTSATEAAPDRSLPASEESKKELGVEKWLVEPGDPGRWWIAGYDAKGKVVVDLVVMGQRDGNDRGSVTYDVHGKLNFHLVISWIGEQGRSDAKDLAESDREAARALFERIAGDLDAAQAIQDEKDALLAPQSVAVSLSPQGGHVGGPLVRRESEDLVKRGMCLLDRDFKPCGGKAVRLAIGMLGIGACTAAGGWILVTVACLAAAKDTMDTIEGMAEKECIDRPCSQKK